MKIAILLEELFPKGNTGRPLPETLLRTLSRYGWVIDQQAPFDDGEDILLQLQHVPSPRPLGIPHPADR